MSTFDETPGNTDMGTGEPELSAQAIARALRKLGFNFDPATEEGRLRAAEFVNEALSDRATTDAIIAALETDAAVATDSASEDAIHTAKPLVPKRIFSERTAADDFLMDDVPTRGRLLTAIDRNATHITEHRDRAGLFWPHASKQSWNPVADVALIAEFLSSALLLLPAARPSFFDRVLVLFGHDYPWTPPVCAFTHYDAPDSARLTIRFGATDIHLKYTASRDTFAVARENDGAKDWLLQARPADGDPAQFSRDLLDAFEGRADHARVALASLRSALNESARVAT